MYTPGPWRFEESTKTIRSEPQNYWLATMDSFDGAVNHDANARLMATAPELLASLRSARLMLYAWRGARINIGLSDDHDELNDLIAEIEAVIAKATA